MSTTRENRFLSGDAFFIQYRNFFVGIFLLIPVLAVPILVVFTLINSDVFEKWATLHVAYDASTRIEKGNAVTVRGIKVGHIQSVQLGETGLVQVAFRIREEYLPLVKRNSRALLRQKNMVVGDWEIEITAGTPDAEGVESGDTLAPLFPIDVDKTIASITNMVNTFEGLLQHMLAGKGTIGRLLLQDTLYTQLVTLSQNANFLVGNLRLTAGKVNGMVDTFSRLGGSGNELIDSVFTLSRRLNRLMVNVDILATHIDTLVLRMQATPGKVDKVLTGLSNDVEEAEVLLRALQKHWLFRRRVREVREEKDAESLPAQ